MRAGKPTTGTFAEVRSEVFHITMLSISKVWSGPDCFIHYQANPLTAG